MSLLDRLTARADELATRAEHLRKDLAEIEDDLHRARVAEQAVAQILAEEGLDGAEPDEGSEEDCEEDCGPVEPVYSVMLSRERALALLPGGRLIPYRHESDGVQALPADYQALLAVVQAADGPLPCKTVCERAGLGTEPGQVEGARAKLKRLQGRGWLRRTAAGTFTAIPCAGPILPARRTLPRLDVPGGAWRV